MNEVRYDRFVVTSGVTVEKRRKPDAGTDQPPAAKDAPPPKA